MNKVEELSRKKIKEFNSVSELIHAYIHVHYLSDEEEVDEEEAFDILPLGLDENIKEINEWLIFVKRFSKEISKKNLNRIINKKKK